MNLDWTWTKPTTAGWYMINFGDVVTDANMQPVQIIEKDGQLISIDFNNESVPLKDISNSFKYLELIELSKFIDKTNLNKILAEHID